MAGPTLHYRDEEGKVFEVPKDQVATAERAGLVPASKADVDAALKREEAQSFTNKALTFGEGAASGAIDAATAIPRAVTAVGSHVAGVADPLAGMTGRDALETAAYTAGGGGLEGGAAALEYAGEARRRATENSGWATAGTIGGQIAGAGLGGAAGLARGAGAAASRLAGGSLLARVGGAGVAGALEGAPLSLVAAQDEAYIQNRRLTGEQALAAMGTGALIGGGVGIAARGLGEALGAAKDKVVQRFAKPATGDDAVRVAEQQFGEAAPGLRDAYANMSGAVSGKDPAAIRSLVAGGEEGAAARKVAVFEGDSIREASKRAVREHVDEMAGATRNLTEEWRGPLKVDNVRKTIAKGEEAFVSQSNQAIDQLHGIQSKLNEMLEDSAAYGERAKLSKLNRFVEVASRDAAAALEAGDGAAAFTALNGLKQRMGPLASPGRMITNSADMAVAQEMRGLYEGLRTSLEDEAVWGGAAAMQKEVNEPFTRWMRSKNLFDRRFMTETGDVAANPWERTFGADPSKINGYIEGLTSAKNDLDHQLIRKHIANTKDLAASLAKAGELTPEKAAELQRVVKAAEGFEGTVAKAENSLVLSNQLRELERLDGGSVAGMAPTMGAVLGGPVGAALGAAYNAVANPGKMVRRMAVIERMAEKAGVGVGESLDRLFAGIEGAGKKVAQAGAVARPVPTALELFQGKHATPELAYRERVQEVMAANANMGQRVRDNAARLFGSTADYDPHSVGAAVVAASKGIQLLSERAPVGLNDPKSLTPMTSKPTPSRLEIQEYAQLWTAVSRPMAVIADIPKGTVTRDQIDAIHAVYPTLYENIRTQTWQRLQQLDAKGVEVPIRQRLILDSLLDLNGAGEPVFSTNFAIKYQGPMSDGAAVAQQPTRRPAPTQSKADDRLSTATSEMIGGQ